MRSGGGAGNRTRVRLSSFVRVYVRSAAFVLTADLASALAEPAASRVFSRPPSPDEELDQPARMTPPRLSRHRARACSLLWFLIRQRERDFRWQLDCLRRGFSEDSAPRHAADDLDHPSKPIAPWKRRAW